MSFLCVDCYECVWNVEIIDEIDLCLIGLLRSNRPPVMLDLVGEASYRKAFRAHVQRRRRSEPQLDIFQIKSVKTIVYAFTSCIVRRTKYHC